VGSEASDRAPEGADVRRVPGDPPSAEAASRAVFAEVDRGIAILGELLALLDAGPDAGGREALRARYDALRARRQRDVLHVAVVGEKKSGKSTFLNAVLGARLLGAAARECTGTVTTIVRGEPGWRAELVGGGVEAGPGTRGARETAPVANARPAEDGSAPWSDQERRLHEEDRDLAARVTRARAALDATTAAVEAAERARAEVEQDVGSARTQVGHASAALEAAQAGVAASHVDVTLALAAVEPLPWYFARVSWFAVLLLTLDGWLWPARRARRADQEAAAETCRKQAEEHAVALERAEAAWVKAGRALAGAEVTFPATVTAHADALAACADSTAHLAAATARHDAHRARWREADRSFRTAFAAEIRALTSMDERGRDVARLALSWPSQRLPPGIVLFDTPGVNTDDAENQRRAWLAIDDADGCIVVSDLQQAVSQTTLAFVERVRTQVPHLVLVLTKQDRALENAEADGEGAEAVEEARAVGARRFARQVGQPVDAIFALAVAAEPALKVEESREPWDRSPWPGEADPPTERSAPPPSPFDAELSRLFGFLAEERLTILSARCAAALASGREEVARVQEAATVASRARIAALEAGRIVDPARFRAERLAAAVRAVAEGMEGEKVLARTRLDLRLKPVEEAVEAELHSRRDRAELELWATTLGTRLSPLMDDARNRCADAMLAGAGRLHGRVEAPLIASFEERYRVAIGSVGPALEASAPLEIGMPALARAELDLATIGAGLGGAAAGAIVGALLLPGIGALLGGAIGAFASRFAPQPSLTEQHEAALQRWFAETRRALSTWSDNHADALRDELQTQLAARIDAELSRYAAWIEGRIAEERAAIEAERGRLEALESVGRRLG
jgi:hypothetical protein